MIKKILAGTLLATLALTAIAPAAIASTQTPSARNIVERTVGINNRTGTFDTLIAAVLCTPGIADALSTTPDITVFAPTDWAFRKAGLNKNNICSALDDEARGNVLTYHVHAEGSVRYPQARRLASRYPGTRITMLNEEVARLIKRRAGGLAIDGANSRPSRVLGSVRASNGVIHVVNNVLLP